MTIAVLYYSTYGSTFALAQHISDGVAAADAGQDAVLRRVHELMPDDRLDDKSRAVAAAQSEVEYADVEELATFDGLIIGSPTRFGNRAAQMSEFLDQTGHLWQTGALVGRPCGFFTGASTIHGGHESTILTMATFAFHHGMVIVPLGYVADELQATRTGGGPYGPTHLSPNDGSKSGLSDDEIAIGIAYGRHFARVAAKLAA